MKNQLLISLRTLRLSLDTGKITPAEYQERRQSILDSFEPPSRELSPVEGEGVSRTDEQECTVNELLDDPDTVVDFLGDLSQPGPTIFEADTVALDSLGEDEP
jgi:hypothetical protein